MRIVLLGPPGAGKGTQAHRLADRFGLALIATGDIFRRNLKEETPLGLKAREYMDEGDLVPDGIVVEMVLHRLAEPDCDNGFILDGFPRTLPQAEALDGSLIESDRPLDASLKFVLPNETAVQRLAGRRTCSNCQRTYHMDFKPPVVDSVCDVCGGELIQRKDDEEHTVRHRIAVYHRDTEPMEAFFAERGLLYGVDAVGTVDEVTLRAVEALEALRQPVEGP